MSTRENIRLIARAPLASGFTNSLFFLFFFCVCKILMIGYIIRRDIVSLRILKKSICISSGYSKEPSK